MGRISQMVTAVMSGILRRRDRLPEFLNRIIDDVAKNPDGFAGRLASTALGARNSASAPSATSVPTAPLRVYIGPTNYAGQGFRWARALEQAFPDVEARSMAVELPGGFAFPADSVVPVAVYNHSTAWQEAELKAVEKFSHVMFEAERPLFGARFGRDVGREAAALRQRGLSIALLCHGTDIRSPRVHRELSPWSHLADLDDRAVVKLQQDADDNRRILDRMHAPVFISTPDLLVDVPEGIWCPVVVDPDAWLGGRELDSARVPVVVHAPSMGPVKGTQLIEPAVRRLAGSGVIEYREITGVAAAGMPAVIGDADIVLDQFRIGSYGVAACEAMAAGRVVIGFVLPMVREYVLSETGLELPIVDATPDSIAEVIAALATNPERMAAIGTAGQQFVHAVHSGDRSASALRSHWLGT